MARGINSAGLQPIIVSISAAVAPAANAMSSHHLEVPIF
jgi:hypothetical protein